MLVLTQFGRRTKPICQASALVPPQDQQFTLLPIDVAFIITIVARDLAFGNADIEGKNSGSHLIYICHITDKKLNNSKTGENLF